jgi:hypothetical protein
MASKAVPTQPTQSLDNAYLIFSRTYTQSEAFRNFYAEAKEFVGDAEGLDRARKFTEFVRNSIEYDIGNDHNLDMESILRDRSGTCKHKASLLCQMLLLEHYDAKEEGGTVVLDKNIRDGEHGWVSLNYEGEKYLLDPTNMLFGRYSDFSIDRQPVHASLLRTTYEYGPFRIRRRTEIGVDYQYETHWDWFADGILRRDPQQVHEASERLKAKRDAMVRSMDELRLAIGKGEGRKALAEKEMASAVAFSLWCSSSADEMKKLEAPQ